MTAGLRIITPAEPIVLGRGFYQLEEESLYVQIGNFDIEHRFFSWLESDTVRLELDRFGRLIFIEVDSPRRNWIVDCTVTAPDVVESAAIRWIDFRADLPDPKIITNSLRTSMSLQFGANQPERFFYAADSVIIGVSADNRLVSIWIDAISDDLAGAEIAAFRRSTRSIAHTHAKQVTRSQ